jgi:nucleoside phosphorylase
MIDLPWQAEDVQTRQAVILTALEVETRAVLRQLKDVQEETVKQTVFHVGRFEEWEVAVAECGPGNVQGRQHRGASHQLLQP